MEYKSIILEKTEGIAHISLNRPKALNALTRDMLHELKAAQEEITNDESTRVVIITGKGRAFCSGADFSLISHLLSLNQKRLFEELRAIQDVASGFESMPKPVIAAINGYALGAGLDLALACDFRIAAKGARLGEQYIKVGLIPDFGGSQRLPRLVGLAKAKEMIFLGDMIGGDEAQRIGLVNRAVPDEELEAESKALALRLAAGPTTAIGLAKKAIHEGMDKDIESGLEIEAYCQTFAMQTQDAKEGLSAIEHKETPKFTGK